MTGVLNITKGNGDGGPKYNKIIKPFSKGSKKKKLLKQKLLSHAIVVIKKKLL